MCSMLTIIGPTIVVLNAPVYLSVVCDAVLEIVDNSICNL